ncbi:MAG: phosphoribosyltransferase family protein [Flavobacteriales bacterium]|nr:phosphoribosyltransferase family protein [Flavobacteriales bacterium]
MKTLILDTQQIQQKINRLAYQVYEKNYTESTITIAGIAPNGYALAELIAEKLRSISPIQVELIKLTVNKENPLQSEIQSSAGSSAIFDKGIIILVDDVLNTGKTMMYGVKYFLEFPLKKLQTLVLVDRDHKLFPIKADFIGLSLSTNLQEHVNVQISENIMAVYLE